VTENVCIDSRFVLICRIVQYRQGLLILIIHSLALSSDSSENAIVILTVNGEEIETTLWHKFYTDEGWVEAGSLEEGDYLLSLGGIYGEVDSVFIEEHTQTIYDLTVEEVHTFAVGDGEWVVHNTCGDVNKRFFGGRNIFSDFANADPVSSATELDVLRNSGQEWTNAVRLIQDDAAWGSAGGPDVRSRNIRVDTFETATSLLGESRGITIDANMDPLDLATEHSYGSGTGRTSWEIHPNEGSTNAPSNNLPHIKWQDGRGRSGHIFFGNAGERWGIPVLDDVDG
jgi:hypothetical protein